MAGTLIPYRRRATPLRLGPHDRITLAGFAYCSPTPRPAGDGWELRRDDLPKLGVSLTHEEIDELKGRPGYAYQRDHYDPTVVRHRAATGATSMDDVPRKEQPKVQFKAEVCRRVDRLYREGKLSLTDEGIAAGLLIVKAEMAQLECARVRHKPKARSRRADGHAHARTGSEPPRRRGGRQAGVPASGEPEDAMRRMPPVATFWKWWAKYLKGGRRPWALRDEYQNCGVAPQPIGEEAAGVLAEMGRKRMTVERPSKAQLLLDMRAAIGTLNEGREPQDRVRCPSRAQLNAHLDSLEHVRVVAGRKGLAAARKEMTVVTQGVGAIRPLQRVEMDHWEVHLMNILVALGLWHRLSRAQRRRIRRMHLCVAIDCATKVILGMHLSETPTTADALAVVRMIVSDKQGFADAVGAHLPWDMSGTPETIATDGGSAFTSEEFCLAVAGLLCDHVIPPGGLPQLRGTVERFFRTVHMRLIARFKGRTFENTLAKGDYPAKDLAHLDTYELAWVIVRWVVDFYHATPHAGLGNMTPRTAWRQGVELYGTTPPPDGNTRRAIFGIRLVRTLGNEGIRIMGLRYWSEELVRLFLDQGKQEVEVKLDPDDVGEISVRIGRSWHAARCVRAEVHGVSLRTWIEAAIEMRRVNADMAAITASVSLEAIRAVETVSALAQAREGIAAVTPTEAQIEHFERSILYGFHLPDPVAADDVQDDPLARAIPVTGPRNASPPDEPNKTLEAAPERLPRADEAHPPENIGITPDPIDDDFSFED